MNFFSKAWCFFKRDAIETLSYRTQIVLDGIQISANCAVFFFLSRYFGLSLEKHLFPDAPSVGYFPYVLLGLAMADFQVTALQSFSKAIYRELGSGTLEAILVTGTNLFEVMAASFFWSLTYALGRLCFYFFLGLFIFKINLRGIHMLPIFLTFTLTLASLLGFGLISAGNALMLKRGDPLEYGLRGLSKFFSGIYFPVTALPVWLQGISFFLPLTAALTAARKCFFEAATVGMILPEMAALCGFAGAMIPLGVLYFRWAFWKAKKEGSLSFF